MYTVTHIAPKSDICVQSYKKTGISFVCVVVENKIFGKCLAVYLIKSDILYNVLKTWISYKVGAVVENRYEFKSVIYSIPSVKNSILVNLVFVFSNLTWIKKNPERVKIYIFC